MIMPLGMLYPIELSKEFLEKIGLKLGPALTMLTGKGLSFWAITDKPKQQFTIAYGKTLDSNKLQVESDNAGLFKLEINELVPGEEYFYRIGMNIYSFNMPKTKNFSFVVWGDSQAPSNSGYRYFSGHMVSAIKNSKPDFILTTGDLTEEYIEGSVARWEKQFYGPLRSVLEKTPWLPVRGNHDVQDPEVNNMMLKHKDNSFYLSRVGDVCFVILDTNIPYTPESTQYNWLKEIMETAQWTTAKYRLVSFHHPAWTQLWEAEDYPDGQDVAKYLIPLLEKGGVSAILNGHVHCYLHGNRQTERGNVHYFILGGGGGGLDTKIVKNSQNIPLENVVTFPKHHFASFKVGPKNIEVNIIDPISGQSLDRVIIYPAENL